MKRLKRKRHWRADILAAFERALKQYDSGATEVEELKDLYKLGATIAAENREIKDPTVIKRMAEYAEELVEEDHALGPENEYQVLYHFVSAYLFAHVPANILKEMEADRIMDYVNDTVDLFIKPEYEEPEPELSDLPIQSSVLPFRDGPAERAFDVETPAYDPSIAPDKGEWLALDEGEQLDIVAVFHESHGEFGNSLDVHAGIHVVIETQLALDTPEVTAALDRLMKQGLTRHDVIHAIGTVFLESIHDLVESDHTSDGDDNERYYERLSSFNAVDWLDEE
jgi:hypothetical protein